MKCVFDLEADNLLEDATTVHCGSFLDVDTGRVYEFRPHEIADMLAFMDSCTHLIGQNVLGYDFPLLRKLHNYEYTGRKLDLLYLSRELFKNTPVPDAMKADYKEAGKPLSGPHSVAAWGYRLGRGKVDYDDWETFDEGMMHRCTEDVQIQTLMYRYMQEEIKRVKLPNKVIWQTMQFMEIMEKQKVYGWKLDLERCERYVRQLTKWVRWIDGILLQHLPYLPMKKEDRVGVDGTTNGFQNPYTKTGKLHANLLSWMTNTMTPERITTFSEEVSGPFCRVLWRKVDANSDKEIKWYLLNEGWIPDEYNYSKTQFDSDGNPVKTSPKLSADDPFLGVNGRIGRLICKRVQCRHRLSNISGKAETSGWLKKVRKDGRLESRISGFADTMRVRHAGLANVPKVDSFFGKQMRRCFIADKGKVLVSADAASCQDRMLISRAMDEGVSDPIFEDMILNGDSKRGTDSHTRALKEINPVLQSALGIQILRSDAKNFNFAYKFNCGDKKFGRMAGVTDDNKAKAVGAKIRVGLDNIFNAQVKLQEILVSRWKETARIRKKKVKKNGREFEFDEFYNGKVECIDGRKLTVRNEKDVLVYTVQSDEAIMMQRACIILHDKMEKAGYKHGDKWGQVCFYHDEINSECDPDIADFLKKATEESITEAGNYYGITMPQVGEGAIGNNWMQIH
jgi:DNA polymerase-1